MAIAFWARVDYQYTPLQIAVSVVAYLIPVVLGAVILDRTAKRPRRQRGGPTKTTPLPTARRKSGSNQNRDHGHEDDDENDEATTSPVSPG